MIELCRVCLQPADGAYHPHCLQTLFGGPDVPRVEIELAELHTVALAMVGKTTLSGAQKKVSLGLSTDRQTLRVSLEGEQYILKPPSDVFPALPENERVSMRILEAVGVDVPPLGLIPLVGGSLAYLVRRFDRVAGFKRRQEDFCQLSLRGPKDKYRGSAELCARIIRRYASEPLVELRGLFRRLLASWLVGDGDLHLKNLSLLQGDDGRHRLSPAYDVINTRLYIPDDHLALTVRGRDARLQRSHWLGFAADVGLRRPAASRVLDEVVSAREAVLNLIAASGLPANLADAYRGLVVARFAALR